MTLFEANPYALHQLISRLHEAHEKLSDFIQDILPAGTHFLGTFQADHKQQVESELNQMFSYVREASYQSDHLLSALQHLLTELQQIESLNFMN